MSDDLLGMIWVGVALALLLACLFGVVMSTLKDLRRNDKGRTKGREGSAGGDGETF